MEIVMYCGKNGIQQAFDKLANCTGFEMGRGQIWRGHLLTFNGHEVEIFDVSVGGPPAVCRGYNLVETYYNLDE
jgi:hypothetical protein